MALAAAGISGLVFSSSEGRATPVVKWPTVVLSPLASLEPVVSDSFATVVVNIPERLARRYSFTTGELMNGKALPSDFLDPDETYPVGVGMRSYPTPLISARIKRKSKRPEWHVPRSDWAGELAGTVVPFDSPVNPFRVRLPDGSIEGYFVTLTDEGIGIHSTSEFHSVGKLSSHGCLRMRLDHVKEIHRLPVGTPVEITYNLFRIEHVAEGLRIEGFRDVYGRYSAGDRRALLDVHLAYHGIPPGMLYEDEVKTILSGKYIVVPAARLTRVPRIVQYPRGM